MLETLAAVRASLAVPITGQYALSPDDAGKPDLLGALFVDDDRLVDPFSREEIELFKGIAAQAATTLRNSAAYEARKERDRLAALGEMAAGLAHEIRNPLGAIKGAVQVLEPDRRKLDAPSHEFLDVIVEEVDRLNRVVSQFLAYSRPFRGDMGLVDIVAVVDRTIRLIDGDKRECIEVRTTATALPMLLGDADALGQVVHNLLRNALDAVATLIDRAPKVTVTLSVARRGLVRQDAVAIEVDDNGPGLSAHTLTNLFVPFHTTKSGGTGLGLPVTHRIVEHHHGAIEVGESPTGGARFTVLLPVADAITMSSVRLPSEPDPDGPQPQSALPSESS
jgi:signal transduction histidine kinase